jgi:acyl-CoA thioesterase
VAEPGAFERDTAVRRLTGSGAGERGAPIAFTAEVSPEWRAGRGPHGGYIAAIVVRALVEALADEARAPRSVTIHYPRAPAPGPLQISVVRERDGRSLSTLSARVEQDGAPVALALGAFSPAWGELEVAELPMPEVAAVDSERETASWLAERIEAGMAPQFLRHLVVQPRIGPPPFSGTEAPMEVGAWVGVREPTGGLDAMALALFSDALYSPPFVRFSTPATSPTIDLTIHFRDDLTSLAGSREMCFARFRSSVVHEGFFEEDGVIWSAQGRVLAQSRQLAILLPLSEGQGFA